MAYTPANLSLTSSAPLAGAGQVWTHNSADAAAAVDTDGFFSDAGSRGVKVGDLIRHRDTGTGITTQHYVSAVSSTYPGAADTNDGTVVASGTDTD